MKKDNQYAYISVERLATSGAWVITGLMNDGNGDYYHSQRFEGYSCRKAVELFTEQNHDLLVKA